MIELRSSSGEALQAAQYFNHFYNDGWAVYSKDNKVVVVLPNLKIAKERGLPDRIAVLTGNTFNEDIEIEYVTELP